MVGAFAEPPQSDSENQDEQQQHTQNHAGHDGDESQVVNQQGRDDQHGVIDVERRQQGVQADAGDHFVLDPLFRAGDEDSPDADADQDDVVQPMLGIGGERTGTRPDAQAKEPKDGIGIEVRKQQYDSQQSRRNKDHPTDFSETVGQQKTFEHGSNFLRLYRSCLCKCKVYFTKIQPNLTNFLVEASRSVT